VIEGITSGFGKKTNRYEGPDNFRRIEGKSMQNTNAYVATEEREETPNEGKAGQQLEQVLASGLPSLYRRGSAGAISGFWYGVGRQGWTEGHRCRLVISKVRCWLEFSFPAGLQRRRIGSAVPYLRERWLSDMVWYVHCGWVPFSWSTALDARADFTSAPGRSRRSVSSKVMAS
jgi:hypothetical protein